MALLGIGEHGGRVNAYDKEGGLGASLGIHDDGGHVIVSDKDAKSKAALSIGEHGGVVTVKGKGKGMASMAIDEYGKGALITSDEHGFPNQEP